MHRFLQRLRQLFNRGRDRDRILSDETPEEDFAELSPAEKERELERGEAGSR